MKTPKLVRGTYSLKFKDFLDKIRKYPAIHKKNMVKVWIRLKRANKASMKMWDSGTYRKLTDMQKAQIIEMSSKLYTPRQILKRIRKDWNVNYSRNTLFKFLRNNSDIIKAKRERYLKNVDSLRLVHERARIEELTQIFDEAKDIFDKKMQVEALKEIRAEVKGDRLVLDHNINADINMNVKQHLLTTLDTNSIYQLAMLKLFEKHGIDGNKFLTRLKINKNVKDPDTGIVMPGKTLPIKVDEGSYYPQDIKEATIKETKDLGSSNEIMRKALLHKLNVKLKNLEKAKNEVNDKVLEEEDEE
jgi:hypothetical protein